MWVRCKAGGERVVGAVVVQAACREGLGSRFGARARTLNICVMLVTLDVSKLSGWLNAFAPLNIHSMVVTRDVSKLSGWLNFHAVKNMPAMFVTPEVSQLGMSSSISCNPVKSQLMSVTLDVSKLSGWLNAYADCRVERRACEAGRGESREAGGSEAAAAQAACTARGHAWSAPGTCDTWS